MSDFLSPVMRNDVKDPLTFANYCQQTIGVPFPTLQDMIVTKKFIKQLFGHYPHADYATLCRVVDWCLSRNKKPARLYTVVQNFRYAWSDGFLPELDPRPVVDKDLEEQIVLALRVESDPIWQYRFNYCEGVNSRRELYEDWKGTRQKIVLEGILHGSDPIVS